MKPFVLASVVTGTLFFASTSGMAKTKTSKSSTSGARIFIKYSLEYYPSFNTRFDHLLLFPNGTAFDDIPTKPLTSFSEASIRKGLHPRDIGRWKVAGNSLVLTFDKKNRTLKKHARGWFEGKGKPEKDSAYDIYYPVISPPRARMLGLWENSELVVSGTQGGAAPMVAAGSSGVRSFNANGTFSDGRESFVSSTTQNMGDAYKGEGDVVSNNKRKSKSAGKWSISGSLLTLEQNGVRTVQLAFLMPYWTKNMANTDLMIDGDRWKRPEKQKKK